MKSAVLFLSIASLAFAAPAIAEARPGDNNRAERRAERRLERAERPRPNRNARPDRGIPYPQGRPAPVYRPDRDSLGAGWRQQQDDVRRGVRQGRLMPLNRVLPNLQRRLPGRQLDAGLERGFNGQPVYRVRWAAHNGRRIDYIVDARTGQIIGSEGE